MMLMQCDQRVWIWIGFVFEKIQSSRVKFPMGMEIDSFCFIENKNESNNGKTKRGHSNWAKTVLSAPEKSNESTANVKLKYTVDGLVQLKRDEGM